MTTSTQQAPRATLSPVMVSARVQATNRMTLIGIPLIILAGATVMTIAIWAVVRSLGAEASLFSGSTQAPFWYMLVVGAQTVTLSFPFTQALSIARRDFHRGALLNFSLFSLAMGALLWLLGLVEKLSNGWGMGGTMFAFPFRLDEGAALPVGGSPWYLLIYTLFAFTMLNVGFAFGTIFKRGGSLALVTTIVGLVALLIGGVWLCAALDWFPRIAELFPSDRVPLNVSIVLAAISVIAVLVSRALVRRLPA